MNPPNYKYGLIFIGCCQVLWFSRFMDFLTTRYDKVLHETYLEH